MTHKQITVEEIAAFQKDLKPFAETFDLIADHVVITDSEGRILYANKAAERHTGFSLSEMLGKAPGELWGGRMDEHFYKRMWETIKHFKAPFVGEVENKQKEGLTYWQEIRIYPVLDEQGEVKFFIGMEPDITVRKVFEGHKQQYTEELERFNKYLADEKLKVDELTKEVNRLKEQLLKYSE